MDEAILCKRRIAAAATLAWLVSGCGTAPAVRESPRSQAVRRIESIAMPPVLLPGDVQDPGLTKQVFDQVALSLALKGYVMHRVGRPAPRAGSNPQPLGELSDAALAQLLPDGGKHYLLCWIEASPEGGADAASVRIAAALIERETQLVLWRNAAVRAGERSLPEINLMAIAFARWSRQQSPYASPAIRQIEHDRAFNQIVESQKMLEQAIPQLPATLRVLLSTFPERPMTQ